MQKYFLGVLAFFGFSLTSCVGKPQGGIPIQPFVKEKYLGRWYEIARLDHWFERNMSNVYAEYSLREDGLIRVENKGFYDKKQQWKDIVGKAKFADKETVASLKVSFFGPFYGAYKIVALDQNYTYALVIGDNLKYLWILSRLKEIPEKIKKDYLQQAENMGYDIQKLIWVQQNLD